LEGGGILGDIWRYGTEDFGRSIVAGAIGLCCCCCCCGGGGCGDTTAGKLLLLVEGRRVSGVGKREVKVASLSVLSRYSNKSALDMSAAWWCPEKSMERVGVNE